VKAKGYDGVAILSSINDPAGDVPTSTSTANINSIVDEALEEGLKVVLCTPTPFGNYAGWNASRQQLLDDFNAWIRAKAAGDPRIALVEAYDAMGDADPQDLLAAYDSGDGVHFSAAGDQAFADLVESALESFV
jgi:lysophospholipase L1-like esterase